MQLPGRNQSDGTAGSPGNPTGRIRIEAENFSAQQGVRTENCDDLGGTLDVGYIDPGDAITYDVMAPVSGLYTINFLPIWRRAVAPWRLTLSSACLLLMYAQPGAST